MRQTYEREVNLLHEPLHVLPRRIFYHFQSAAFMDSNRAHARFMDKFIALAWYLIMDDHRLVFWPPGATSHLVDDVEIWKSDQKHHGPLGLTLKPGLVTKHHAIHMKAVVQRLPDPDLIEGTTDEELQRLLDCFPEGYVPHDEPTDLRAWLTQWAEWRANDYHGVREHGPLLQTLKESKHAGAEWWAAQRVFDQQQQRVAEAASLRRRAQEQEEQYAGVASQPGSPHSEQAYEGDSPRDDE